MKVNSPPCDSINPQWIAVLSENPNTRQSAIMMTDLHAINAAVRPMMLRK